MEVFPLLLKKGGAVAKIYRISNRGRPFFALTYHTPDGRWVRNFRLLEEAKREGKTILARLAPVKQ